MLFLQRTLQRALAQPQPTALQLACRQKGVQVLLDLTVTYALHAQTSEFAHQIIELTQVWSNEVTGSIEHDDLVAVAGPVQIYVKLHFSPQQRYPRSLPKLVTAFAALLVRRHPNDVPELRSAVNIQQVVHTAFRMLQQLGHEVTFLTPMNWIDIYRRRYILREQQATHADSLAFLADRLAVTHIRDVPFSVTSTASLIGMAAWVVSALLWWRLCSPTQHLSR